MALQKTTDVKLTAAELISAFKLKLFFKSPFLYTLAMFAEYRTFADGIAATDGRFIYFNYEVFLEFSEAERMAVFVHEVLHCALSHVTRRGSRDAEIWNIACDILINNGIIPDFKWCKLPEMGINRPELLRDSTEEIYTLLLDQAKQAQKNEGGDDDDDDSNGSGSGSGSGKSSSSSSKTGKGKAKKAADLIDKLKKELMKDLIPPISENDAKDVDGQASAPMTKEQLETKWGRALQQAASNQEKDKQAGSVPACLQRLIANVGRPQIDWKMTLMNFLVKFPCDYSGYDRRFIGQGRYFDQLEGERLQAYVCIDTSGSISGKQLDLFVSELNGILSSYPQVNLQLYYADANLYGPYQIEQIEDLPKPEGGGGTSFVPFFEAIEQDDSEGSRVAVYLTDGYGNFPSTPEIETLWVTIPNSLPVENFPFGEVIALTYD